MNDFAGVDPQRVRQLADRLSDLATALTKNGAVIRGDFARWGGSLDLGVIAQQAQQVGQDAHDMGLRADEALNLAHGAGQAFACGRNGDLYQIPWDVKDINPSQEAQQEANELHQALANPKDPKSREVILDVAQSMAEHKGDSAYMTAFMISGGIDDTVQAANALHKEDGTHDNAVLSPDSVTALTRFGQAAQVMSDLAVTGKYPHPAPDYLAPLTHLTDDNAWSVGMLFKYGPPGEKWNPKVLSDVGGAMLDWRDKQGAMRPVYNPMPFPGAPPAYYGDGKAWFDHLGFDSVTYPNGKADRTLAAIRANDPVLAVLDKLGDNAQGSRDLLGQDTADSRRHASQLLDYKWQTTGRVNALDDSGPVGKVLTMAATDRSPAFQDQSGMAAHNIIEAAAKENDAFQHRPKDDILSYTGYPQETAVALAGITGTWADQIGSTSMYAGPGSAGYDAKQHSLVVPHDDMVAAMQLFVRNDPSAAAMFDTTMHQQIGDAAGNKDAKQASSDMAALGNMVGLFTKAKNGVSYSAAQQLDEQHKFNTALVNTAGSLFGAFGLPDKVTSIVAKKGLKYTQTLALLGRTIVAPTTDPFSVNNAASQQAVNSANAKDVESSFSPAVAQGLIRSGKVKEPAGASWYDPKTKTVRPEAWNDTDFVTWFRSDGVQEQSQPAMSDVDSGYTRFEGSLDGN